MSKKFKVTTDCGVEIEYDTAYELGFIVGSKGLIMHNQYDPIHLERDEYNEGCVDGRNSNSKPIMDKIKITKQQAETLDIANAAGVMLGLHALIDEVINSIEDVESQELWSKLKERVNYVGHKANNLIEFDITDGDKL